MAQLDGPRGHLPGDHGRPAPPRRPVGAGGRRGPGRRPDRGRRGGRCSRRQPLELGVGPGDRLRLSLLTAEEVRQFDTGFGEPDGPHGRPGGHRHRPGAARRARAARRSSPRPAFADRYGVDRRPASTVYVDLADGPAGSPRSKPTVERLAAALQPAPGRRGVRARSPSSDPRAGTGRGPLVGPGAGGRAVGRGRSWRRRRRAARPRAGPGPPPLGPAPDQRVEAALGLTARRAGRWPGSCPLARRRSWPGASPLAVARWPAPRRAAGRRRRGSSRDPGWRAERRARDRRRSSRWSWLVARPGRRDGRGAPAPSTGTARRRPTAEPGCRLVPWRSGLGAGRRPFALVHGGRRAAASRSARRCVGRGARASPGSWPALDLRRQPRPAGRHAGALGLDGDLDGGRRHRRDRSTSSSPTRASPPSPVIDSVDGQPRRRPTVAAYAYRSPGDLRLDGARRARAAGRPTRCCSAPGWPTASAPTRRPVRLGSGRALRVVGVGLGPAVDGEDLGDSVLLTPDGLAGRGRPAASARRWCGPRRAPTPPRSPPTSAARYELARCASLPRGRRPRRPRRAPRAARRVPRGPGRARAGPRAGRSPPAAGRGTWRCCAPSGSTPARPAGARAWRWPRPPLSVGLAVGVPLGWATARLVWGEVADARSAWRPT